MKTKYFILAALVIGMMVGATSCKKKSATPSTPSQSGQVAEKELTEDQLTVTTDVEAVVYGEQGSTYYFTALKNRLLNKVSAYVDSTTKVIVVFNNYVPQLTSEHYRNIYHCFKNGGSVLVCSPTVENYASIFREGVLNAAYYEDVEKYQTAGITREQWMEYVGNSLFAINGIEQIPAGIVAASVGFHNGKKYVLSRISDDVDPASITNYQYGLMADGAAKWFNETQEDEKISFKSLYGKSNELSDLSDAEVHTVEYTVRVNGRDGWFWNYSNVIQNTLTIYTAYSFKNDYDWYQIDQNITFRNGMISPAPDLNDHFRWWCYGNYDYVRDHGAFTTKMHLTIPEGKTHIYSSHPETANNSYSSSYSTSEGTSTSVTDGGSVGLSIGFCGKSLTGGFSGSYQHSVTTEESFSTTTGMSCTINDLSVTKSTINEDGCDKVKWDYVYKTPYQYWQTAKGSGDSEPTTYYAGWWAAPLAMTDCSQQNSLLYYVENPSGEATIHCYNWWKYYWSMLSDNEMCNDATESSATIDFVIKSPVRYIEEWGFSCVDYGDIAGNDGKIYAFEQAITQDIFNNVNRITNIGGADENDNTDANNLLNLFVDELAMFADSYAARGYTGTYVFQLQSKDTGRILQKSYTIQ